MLLAPQHSRCGSVKLRLCHRQVPRLAAAAGSGSATGSTACTASACRSEPLQQWELEMPEGKEVECLIDRLKVRALLNCKQASMWPGCRRPLSLTPPNPAPKLRLALQEHFASRGPKKSEAQIRAQQADLLSRLPEVGCRTRCRSPACTVA